MKILIITYYFPPCNGIAPNRPNSFANDFSKEHEVKVITRHWSGNENEWEDYLKSDHQLREVEKVNDRLEVIRIPYHSKIRKPNKFRTFVDLMNGKIDSEIDSLQFYEESSRTISQWKPNLLLVSSPPLNLVKLAASLHSKHQLPYIVDFRDFENNIVLNQSNQISFINQIKFYFHSKYTLKHLKNCSYIFSVNEEITDYFKSKLNQPTEVIFNGYENSIFSKFKPLNELKGDIFNISIIGTVYPNQDLKVFLSAFKQVISKLSNPSIQFNFIGTDTIKEIGDIIRNEIPEKHLLITKRLPRLEALKHLEKSHLVWQPEMPGYKGMYTGKIFEYLGAKRIIMIAPSLGDVLDKLLEETQAGKSFKSDLEISSFIVNQYNKWLETGFLEYKGNNDAIDKYSRENQSRKLLNSISKTDEQNQF